MMCRRDAASASAISLMPMIDARRMEVYTALLSEHLKPLAAPSARIFDESTRTMPTTPPPHLAPAEKGLCTLKPWDIAT